MCGYCQASFDRESPTENGDTGELYLGEDSPGPVGGTCGKFFLAGLLEKFVHDTGEISWKNVKKIICFW